MNYLELEHEQWKKKIQRKEDGRISGRRAWMKTYNLTDRKYVSRCLCGLFLASEKSVVHELICKWAQGGLLVDHYFGLGHHTWKGTGLLTMPYLGHIADFKKPLELLGTLGYSYQHSTYSLHHENAQALLIYREWSPTPVRLPKPNYTTEEN